MSYIEQFLKEKTPTISAQVNLYNIENINDYKHLYKTSIKRNHFCVKNEEKNHFGRSPPRTKPKYQNQI